MESVNAMSMRYMKKWTERTRVSHLRSVMPMPAGILPKHLKAIPKEQRDKAKGTGTDSRDLSHG